MHLILLPSHQPALVFLATLLKKSHFKTEKTASQKVKRKEIESDCA